MSENPQKIIRLDIQNVMKISAVEIFPDGNMVVVGGLNEQGKSAVLNAIWFALGGKQNIADEPIKRGRQKAKATIELTNYIVERTWTAAGGTNLKVMTKEGEPLKKPQEILDNLVGDLAFDPLEFVRFATKDAAKAIDVLKKIAGLDFTALDAKRKELYDSRTMKGRELDSAKGKVAAYTHDPTAPTKEVSTADLLKELEVIQTKNQSNATARSKRQPVVDAIGQTEKSIASQKTRVSQLEAELATARESLASFEKVLVTKNGELFGINREIEALVDQDEKPVRDRISTAGEDNKKLQNNKRRAELVAEAKKYSDEYDSLTTAIEEVEKEKSDQLAKAKFPIPAISFNDSGVLLNDIPFSQASSAGRLRASIAIGMALNPKLRVMLIREGGNDLDPNSLKMVADMAQEHDMQIFLERCSTGPECSFIIHDGTVQTETEQPETVTT